MAGLRPPARIIPFRGEYYELRPDRRDLVNGLIYPVPDPQFPFLGVHLTRMIDGSVHAGPNAVLALAREGYCWRRIRPRDLAEAAAYPGLWRLARRHLRYGLDRGPAVAVSRASSRQSLARLVPELTRDDIVRAGAGVRAQAIAPRRQPRRRLPDRARPPPGARAQRAVAGGHQLAGDRQAHRGPAGAVRPCTGSCGPGAHGQARTVVADDHAGAAVAARVRGGRAGPLRRRSLIIALLAPLGATGRVGRSGRGAAWPAAAAGGACQLLDYDASRRRSGPASTPRAAAAEDETYTCALTQAGHDYPDLTLAVTATEADEAIFTATVTPSGSTAVKGLGKVAYRSRVAGRQAQRPGCGGRLALRQRALMILRYTFAAGRHGAARSTELTPKLIALAKQIDRRRPDPRRCRATAARLAALAGQRAATNTREATSRGSRTMSPSRSTTTESRSCATITLAPGSTPAAWSWRSTSASVCTLSQIRLTIDLAGQAGEGEVALGRVAQPARRAAGVELVQPGIGLPYGERVGRPEQLVDLLLHRLAHHVLPPARLLVGLLVGHADDVDQQQFGESVLAHDRDRLGAARLGERKMAVALDGQQAVALHPGHRLAHGRTALVQPLGDAGAQRRHTLLLQLEDGAQIHLGRVDEIIHSRRPSRGRCYPDPLTSAACDRRQDPSAVAPCPDVATGDGGTAWC